MEPVGCELCEILSREGWWGTTLKTHCQKCHYTWTTATRQAHCTYCHRHFTSPTGFDDHLKTGTDGRSIFHLDPAASKGRLPYARNEQGAWYSPRPEDSYPHDPVSPVGNRTGDESSTSLDLDTRGPSASLLAPDLLSWIPKSK